MNPLPEADEVSTLLFIANSFCEKYMMVDGTIENRTLIVDCKDMWIWNFASILPEVQKIVTAIGF